jgi:ribosomal protein S7
VGKKSTAERICYGAFDLIQEKTNGGDPMKIFKSAIDNVKPVVEVKSRRVGGASYQVPVEIRPLVVFRWLCDGLPNTPVRVAGRVCRIGLPLNCWMPPIIPVRQ